VSSVQASTAQEGSLPAWLFPAVALSALALHAFRLFQPAGLEGGLDLLAHLRMVELMGLAPALRNVQPPAYHVLGALVAPLVGLANYPRLFAVLATGLAMAGFRYFQRSARLPDHASLLFVLWPYAFTLSWTIPRNEVAAYALTFLGLGLLLRRHYVGLALALAATFYVHTAGAIFFGLAAGVLALARRDVRGIAALAVGTLGVVPLLIAHLGAGCTLQQALLLAEGDYLHIETHTGTLHRWPLILALASPPILAAAVLGARGLWERWRPIAVLCAVLVVLFLQEVWLYPFQASTTATLMRGLSFLVIPAATAGGVFLARRPRLAPWFLGIAAIWCLGTTFSVAKKPMYTRPISLDEIRDLRMVRCRFGWRAPHAAHRKDPSLKGKRYQP
jgi:hypothetical protein